MIEKINIEHFKRITLYIIYIKHIVILLGVYYLTKLNMLVLYAYI